MSVRIRSGKWKIVRGIMFATRRVLAQLVDNPGPAPLGSP